jgi:hypothetical protein
MPNIAGIYVSFGSETECSVASASNVFLNCVVPLFREQYRLVDNSILLLVCLGRSVEYAGPQRMHRASKKKKKLVSLCVKVLIRPMIRSVKQNRLVSLKLVVNGSADVL